MGLYNNYGPMIQQPPLDATQMANNFIGNNSMYNTGTTYGGPQNFNWDNTQKQLPYGGTIDTNNIATGNNFDSAFNADSIGEWWDGVDMNSTLAGLSDFAGVAGGLYGMYQGDRMLGLYGQQVEDSRKALNSNLEDASISRNNRLSNKKTFANARVL